MGGKVLDLLEFKIYDQGKADGKAEGEKERKELAQENAQLKSRIEELEKS